MSERGFLSAALIQLIIYAAIAAAVVAAVYWVYSSIKGIGYRDAVAVWQPKYEALDKQFNDFTANVKAQGDAAQKEKDRKDAEALKTNKEFRNEIATRDARLRELARLRDAGPPVRPDGSSVPVSGGCPSGTVGQAADGRLPAAEFVPLPDLRECQARLAYDAETVTLWRTWRERHNIPVE